MHVQEQGNEIKHNSVSTRKFKQLLLYTAAVTNYKHLYDSTKIYLHNHHMVRWNTITIKTNYGDTSKRL